MSNSALKYRSDIDGLRAVAVLSVVAFHASSRLLPGGFAGVDVFFVISGYLISKIILAELVNGGFSFLDFYSRRIRRIFPALILVLLSTWGAGYLWLEPSAYEALGKHMLAGAGFVANIAYWLETGYFDTASDLKPLLHLWSLGVEEQFYVVWPILLLLSWRYFGGFWGVILISFVFSFLANLVWVRSNTADAFYLPFSRFWELLVGAALAWHSLSEKQFRLTNKSRDLISIAGGALILLAVVGLNKSMQFPGWWALLPVAGAALLIYSGPDAFINRVVLSRRPMVFIGLISYPLYLWHWPMFAFTRISGYDFKYRVGATVIAIALSYLTYRYFEQPVRSGVLKKNSKVPIVLSVLVLCLGILGLSTYQSAGYANRYPEYIINVIRYEKTFDLVGSWRAGSCFKLTLEDYKNNFPEFCGGDAAEKRTGSVVLWGDSIAGSLYPGLAKLHSEGDRAIAQYTTSNCPPFLDFDDPNNQYCRRINDFVKEKVSEIKPETVVISGYWIKYTKYAGYDRDFDVAKLLTQTVDYLRGIGVKNIIVVGPLPLWIPQLPKTIFSEWKESKLIPSPLMLANGLDTDSFIFDQELKEKMQPVGVEYVSAMSVFCKNNACMTRVGDAWSDLSTFDTMHLTESSAYFLAKHLPKLQRDRIE